MENVKGYSTKEINKDYINKIAKDHVDWYLSILRQPMVEEFVHGYKHGYEDGKKQVNE